jgi:hypothetical protein
MNVFNRFGRFLQMMLYNCDKLGPRVQLKYRGRTRFNTKCGGALTLMAIFIVIAFASTSIKNLINKEFTYSQATYPNYFKKDLV